MIKTEEELIWEAYSNPTDEKINKLLSDYIISSLDDYPKRNHIIDQLISIEIPNEYKNVPSTVMFRLETNDTTTSGYKSFSYDIRGINKIKEFYKKDYNIENFKIKEYPVKNVLICIPTFYKNTKIHNGKYFEKMWRSEYEVIAYI